MKTLARTFIVLAIFLAFTTFVHADPTKDKTPAQEMAEKFITLFMKQDFSGAASLATIESGVLQKDIELLKEYFDKQTKEQQYYKKINGTLISRELAPQTLVTFRRGDDGKEFNVLTFFTEHHRVSVPVAGKQQVWHFYWHMDYMITVKENKISGFDLQNVQFLMKLRPEDCILPAVCPQ